jgi:cyclopropane fatty-acyl-phospholipid synthase-like methyltransferase
MDHSFRHLKGKLQSGRVYSEFYPFQPGDMVANIGCGEGPQAIVYAGQYKNMVGVDINKQRLTLSTKAMQNYGITNYTPICADVENTGLVSRRFDKVIAIDIIEHVRDPRRMCLEANRLLQENGELLITFPAMHDIMKDFMKDAGRFILRKPRKHQDPNQWNPDFHNQAFPLSEWISLVESCGFKLKKSRASTLFPPLHIFGLPRFWFSNDTIHQIDSFFCNLPLLKNYGQALVCVFVKAKDMTG